MVVETSDVLYPADFSNFGSLKSTETRRPRGALPVRAAFQQFRLVEEH